MHRRNRTEQMGKNFLSLFFGGRGAFLLIFIGDMYVVFVVLLSKGHRVASCSVSHACVGQIKKEGFYLWVKQQCHKVHIAFSQKQHPHLTPIPMWHLLLSWMHVYYSVSASCEFGWTGTITQQGCIILKVKMQLSEFHSHQIILRDFHKKRNKSWAFCA